MEMSSHEEIISDFSLFERGDLHSFNDHVVLRVPPVVLSTVDLTQRKDLSLHLERVGSDPYCEMSVDSVVKEKITVAAGTKASLSFLDCPVEEVRLTANQIISKDSGVSSFFR